jgi:hypothetical protein
MYSQGAVYFAVNPSQIHECRNWERGSAVSFLGIFVSNFQYSVFAVYKVKKVTLITFKQGTLRALNNNLSIARTDLKGV